MTRNFSVLLTCLLGSVASGVVLTPLAEMRLQANGISSPAGHTVQTGTVTRLSTISTSRYPGTLHSVIFPMFPDDRAYASIDASIPDHDVLLCRFPLPTVQYCRCQQKNSLGRKHGFECDTRGPFLMSPGSSEPNSSAIFVLGERKNLKSHDKGNTFRIIMKALDELGYDVADCDAHGSKDPKIIDGKNFRPQHRERIVLVGFSRDLKLHDGFSFVVYRLFILHDGQPLGDCWTLRSIAVTSFLQSSGNTFITTLKSTGKGNGFGFGLVNPFDKSVVCRTLSARYYRDGSEILLDRGWDHSIGKKRTLMIL